MDICPPDPTNKNLPEYKHLLRYSIASGKVPYTCLETKTHGKLPDVEFSKFP
jgi:hypothetical protein